jgi:hypothetical protein
LLFRPLEAQCRSGSKSTAQQESPRGAAAQLAGVPKPYFLIRLADYGVHTFDLSEED